MATQQKKNCRERQHPETKIPQTKKKKIQNFLSPLSLDRDPGKANPFSAASTLPLNLALYFHPFFNSLCARYSASSASAISLERCSNTSGTGVKYGNP